MANYPYNYLVFAGLSGLIITIASDMRGRPYDEISDNYFELGDGFLMVIMVLLGYFGLLITLIIWT